MASFTISNITSTNATITVNDISPGDTVRFYVRLDSGDTALYDFTLTATANTSSKTLTTFTPLTKYAVNINVNGTWIGAQYFTTKSASGASRPSNWSWYSTIIAGGKINLTASEWNNFCSRINEFRVYTGLSEYSFTTVYSGTTKISAAIVNQAYTAISAINGHGTLPSVASSGNPITANFFLTLSNALNAIP